MHLCVVTLFPQIFESFLSCGLFGRAVRSGLLRFDALSLREFAVDRHGSVDDTPYGGGAGMVLRPQPIADALSWADACHADAGFHRVLLTPQGRPFSQRVARDLFDKRDIALVCGRYEGFDERVRGLVHEEISLGDFVMTGGEVAAMAIAETCARFVEGVLGNAESASRESHADGLLEYPQYTRPVEFRGARVPDVLLSGDHARIETWRREQSLRRTRERRPDLLARPSFESPKKDRG